MTTRTDWIDLIEAEIPDNSLNQIQPENIRDPLIDLANSIPFNADLDAAITGIQNEINGIEAFDGDIGAWAAGINTDVSAIQTTLGEKFNTPTGTISQYLRGDGSLATFPSVPSLPIAISNVTSLQTALDSKVATTVTVNGHALSSNVTVTKSDV